VDVACGRDHVLAIDSRGQLWAWGRNFDRQVLNTVTSSYALPQHLSTSVAAFSGLTFRAISAGDDHSLAIDQNGNVWTWGRNDSGQLGRGSVSATLPPAMVGFTGATGNLRAVALAGGAEFSVVLLGDGSVWTTGLNETGQLGTGDTLDLDVFTQVNGVSGVISVAAGRQHVLLRK
jgi:alpha-tubulin suppressor-like RCC1 family protein